MATARSFKSFFERERLAGDLVFAVFFLGLSALLLSQIGSESKWVKGTKVFAQPMFWPAVSLTGMTLFAAGHFLGSVFSRRIAGRMTETLFWFKACEYALWFMLYVWIVPIVGYLPSTMVFCNLLCLRTGYRKKEVYIAATLAAVSIVIVFKGLLSVKIPGGQLYEYLPITLRNFMILYL